MTLQMHGGNQVPSTVQKKWGTDVLLGISKFCAVKEISLLPCQCISRQFHEIKDEIYLVTDGWGVLETGYENRKEIRLNTGEVVHIPPYAVHRIIAGVEGITVVEVSTPEIADIQRVEDQNNRTISREVFKALIPGVEPAIRRQSHIGIKTKTGVIKCLGVSEHLIMSEFTVNSAETITLNPYGGELIYILSGDCMIQASNVEYVMRYPDTLILRRGEQYGVTGGTAGTVLLHGASTMQVQFSTTTALANLAVAVNRQRSLAA